MKLILMFLGLLMLSACAGSPSVRITKGSSDALISQVNISGDRSRANYVLWNPTDHDIYCEGYTTRIVLDDPDSYLETAEQTRTSANVFVRKGERITKSFRVKEFGANEGSQIRSVTTVENRGICRRATAQDFCLFGVRSKEEQQATEQLMHQIGAADCNSLATLAQRSIVIDPPTKVGAPERPAMYFSTSPLD